MFLVGFFPVSYNLGKMSVGEKAELQQGGCMPRDNPKGNVVQEIALISEEIDRLEQYVKDPQSLQTRVQELIAKRAELLVKFREVSTQKPPPREPHSKKKEG